MTYKFIGKKISCTDFFQHREYRCNYSAENMEEHIHHLSKYIIHACSIEYNRNRLTAWEKHL